MTQDLTLATALKAKAQEGLSSSAWGELVLKTIVAEAEKQASSVAPGGSVDVTLKFNVSAHAHPERVQPRCICVILNGTIYACL